MRYRNWLRYRNLLGSFGNALGFGNGGFGNARGGGFGNGFDHGLAPFGGERLPFFFVAGVPEFVRLFPIWPIEAVGEGGGVGEVFADQGEAVAVEGVGWGEGWRQGFACWWFEAGAIDGEVVVGVAECAGVFHDRCLLAWVGG